MCLAAVEAVKIASSYTALPLNHPPFCSSSSSSSLLPPSSSRAPLDPAAEEERDRRTVMVMQLSARVGPKDLQEFFNQMGQVRDVKMISDRNSRRSKGIAYIEFHDDKSVPGVSQM